MGYRKCFSFLISIIMVVAMVSSTVLAGGPDGGQNGDQGDGAQDNANTFTTVSGITLTLPPEYEHVIWPGIAEDDPNLKEIGIKAFRLLLDQMNGDDSVQHVVVKTRMELRDSTR